LLSQRGIRRVSLMLRSYNCDKNDSTKLDVVVSTHFPSRLALMAAPVVLIVLQGRKH
jgi:hypothetical protein